ncbi:hypothetical protein JTB14_015778 [Gonioctena quinquepunctata]|nr:hypothetical protein JTB14_015778 [Gonioctena quinquepunctata]
MKEPTASFTEVLQLNKTSFYVGDEEIATFRAVTSRRRLIRVRSRQAQPESIGQLEIEYKNNRKTYQKEQWKHLCDRLDEDPWGQGHKIVEGRTPYTLNQEKSIEIIQELFPHYDTLEPERHLVPEPPPPFTFEEMFKVTDKTKPRKASGPGGILPEAIKLAVRIIPDMILRINCSLKELKRRANTSMERIGQQMNDNRQARAPKDRSYHPKRPKEGEYPSN